MSSFINLILINILSILGPSIIVLYLFNITKKRTLYCNISLFFIATLLITMINLGILHFVVRVNKVWFLNYSIISILVGIPLTLYIFRLFDNNIDLKKKIKLTFSDVVAYIIMSFAVLLLSYSLYYLYFYTFKDFDSTLYTFFSPLEGVGIEAYIHGLIYCIPMFFIFMFLFMIPISERVNKLKLKYKKKEIQLLPIRFFVKHKIVYSLVLLLVILCYSMYHFYVFKYIFSLSYSNYPLYEKYFIKSEDVKVTFPKKKKNLIFIMAESLESSLISKYNGGSFEDSIIPELENLAKDNINFSTTSSLGGFIAPRSCGWTIAGTMCQTSGIPLKITLDNIFSSTLIPKATTMWDILNKNGYNSKVIMGSVSTFAKTKAFFNDHNVMDIVDYKEIIKREKLPSNYKEWWGVQDRILFKRAKEEIKDLTKDNKPFVTLISTMDTHFPDGYQDKKCQRRQKDNYLQSYSCSSIMINEFISWAQEQDFYKDTIIVITGDHLSMQKSTFNNVKDSDRFVYNVFINTGLEGNNTKNRILTSFDIYPTLLYSMGAEIEGNRLGFGTNLFSNKKTLAEEIGIEKFIKETYVHSPFYKKFDK